MTNALPSDAPYTKNPAAKNATIMQTTVMADGSFGIAIIQEIMRDRMNLRMLAIVIIVTIKNIEKAISEL